MPQRILKLRIKDFIEHIPDSAAIAISTRTTVGAGVAGVYSWISSVNWIGVISVLVAVLGLLVNLFFQRRRYKLEKAESLLRQEESQVRLAKMRGGCE